MSDTDGFDHLSVRVGGVEAKHPAELDSARHAPISFAKRSPVIVETVQTFSKFRLEDCLGKMEQRNLFVPPLNFAMVMPGVYRSGFFNRRNYSFLKNSLKVRSVMYVSCDSYTEHRIGEDNMLFMKENGIKMFACKLNSHKGTFAFTEERIVADALSVLLDVRNHPILLHDDKGKHRAGVLIGCLRKIQGWSLASIFNEYALFTMGSVRFPDMQWIELFSHPIKISVEHVPRWLKLEDEFQRLPESET